MSPSSLKNAESSLDHHAALSSWTGALRRERDPGEKAEAQERNEAGFRHWGTRAMCVLVPLSQSL